MARISSALPALLLALVAWLPSMASAQNDPQVLFSQSDLDQMLAPIALYPDDLLSNVLTASTYPLEVVQADRYVKQNANLQADALADALNTQPWDMSVKSLAQFPSVLAMMDDELSWTQELGDAFMAQPTAVMDTVQALRAKAAANGTLQSNPQEVVQTQGNNIVIQPTVTDVVYVPYYDPTVVYGIWWWPAQPPVFWSPPPLYRPNNFGNVGSGGIAYGGRVTVNGNGFGRFRPNWGTHTISVGSPRRAAVAPGSVASNGVWQHDPTHRQGVPYRSVPSVNRAVQQATPPQLQQQIARPVVQPFQPEPNRAMPVAVPPQRTETIQQRPVVFEPHQPSPQAQRAEPNHGEGSHNEGGHNEAHGSDPHKQN